MILARHELELLTGRKTRRGQIDVLTRNGVRFIVAADGWPRVHEAALLQPADRVVRLPRRTETEPRLDAI